MHPFFHASEVIDVKEGWRSWNSVCRFHASSTCIEAQLYQDNVGPINIKEVIEDSLIED